VLHFRERGEYPDMDRYLGLYAPGHREKHASESSGISTHCFRSSASQYCPVELSTKFCI
jgi:hypothetical protein